MISKQPLRAKKLGKILFDINFAGMTEKRKVLFVDVPNPYLEDQLTAHGFECKMGPELSYEAIKEEIHEYFGLVVRSRIAIDRGLLEKAGRLKFIARVGAGMESIDVECARSLGIECIASPEGNEDAVAEHTLGMLLSLSNNLVKAHGEMQRNIWSRESNRGFEIKGKTIGIIGYGHMGKAFAKRLAGFDVRVLAYDKYKSGYGDQWAEAADLTSLFRETDIFSIHVPLTRETSGMIDSHFIGQFRKPIYLINTARGKIVNTRDLVEQMQQKKVLGAALDVLEYEDRSFENFKLSALPEPFQYLVKAPNVVLTPHVAGWTHESKFKLAKVLADKILAAFAP